MPSVTVAPRGTPDYNHALRIRESAARDRVSINPFLAGVPSRSLSSREEIEAQDPKEAEYEEATRAFLSHGPKAAEYMLSLPIAKRNLVVQFRDPAKGADAPPDNDFMMTGYFVEADGQHWILEWYPWGGPLRPGEPGIRTVIPIGAIRDVWVAPEWVSPESR